MLHLPNFLSLIDEPFLENSSRALLFEYLQLYIGDKKNNEARKFLRSTTGSTVIIADHIKISFNACLGCPDDLLRIPATVC